MNKGPVDDRYKEFEDVLEQMPQEQPPEDLKQRCMDALDAAERTAKPAPVKRGRWDLAWNVMAAAAAVMLIVSATSTLKMRGHQIGDSSDLGHGQSAPAPGATGMGGDGAGVEWQTSEPSGDGGMTYREYCREAGASPIVPRQFTTDENGGDIRATRNSWAQLDRVYGRAGSQRPPSDALGTPPVETPPAALTPKYLGQSPEGRNPFETATAPPPAESAELDTIARPGDGASPKQAGGGVAAGAPVQTEPPPPPGDKLEEAEKTTPSMPPPVVRSVDGLAAGRRLHTPAPAKQAPQKPWRDESGDRQKITRKEMELAVEDVQKAYDDAASIIERADGYVDSDTLVVEQEETDRAHISARVPVWELADVIDRLRELGEVVRLAGETDDLTQEYYAQGSDIRDLGAKEVELVERYEKEKNRARKRALYQQIMAIRAQNSGRKDNLSTLSDQTHYAFLELDLVEKLTPRGFLGDMTEKMAHVGSWAGATAIFWIPLLVLIAYFARRGGRRRVEVRTEE